jgi:hypothetical protein
MADETATEIFRDRIGNELRLLRDPIDDRIGEPRQWHACRINHVFLCVHSSAMRSTSAYAGVASRRRAGVRTGCRRAARGTRLC